MTNSVVSFEVRITTSGNSRLVRHHFSCAISDYFINKIHIELIKIIKEAQTLGIYLSDMIALIGGLGEFDLMSVNDFSAKKTRIEFSKHGSLVCTHCYRQARMVVNYTGKV